jgi:hypothetical protein
MMDKISKKSPTQIAFFQSLGLFSYIAFVALILWRANQWFGPKIGYFGPLFAILLFSLSALICAIITLGIPFYLAWEKKETKKAIRIVTTTALFILLYLLVILVGIMLF